MKNLFTIAYLVLFCNQILFSQEKITNVDTNYLKPLLSDSILKNLIFRNGDKIAICKTEEEWNANNEKNIPSLYINKNEYYYNYRAIKDERNIFPLGYKLPYFHEINITKNRLNYGYIDENGIIKADKENNYFWIANQFDNIEYSNTIHINKTSNVFTKELSPDLKVNGHVVLCIEDLSESIMSKTYDYSLLMPTDYQIFKKQIWDQFPFKNEYENGSEINITALINFNKNGENTSKINSFSTKNFQFENDIVQINTLQLFFKNRLTKPIYYGENVISNSDLNIKIIFQKKSGEYWSNYYLGNYEATVIKYNKLSSSLISDLYTAKDYGLSPVFEYKIKTLKINNQIVDSLTKYVLTSIKTKNTRNNFYSFIPGLGVLHAEPSRKKIPGIKMIHISIPIGIISLASYFYYSSQYNQYLKSSNFSTDTYRSANNAHKVFLTTATAYALLSLIDFSTTINIGRKNKKLAKRINEEINKNYNGGLLLN
jgi:hypothetical protein